MSHDEEAPEGVDESPGGKADEELGQRSREDLDESGAASSIGPEEKPVTPPPAVQPLNEWPVPILVVKGGDKDHKKVGSVAKWRERDVLEVEKKNLLALAKLVVRDVIESSMVQGRMLDSDHVPLQQFLVILEHSLRHGMKIRSGLLAAKREVWDLLQEVERFVPEAREITLSVKELPTVRTSNGRARAWLRLALMQKRLPDYFKALADHREDLLVHFYDPVALMMSDEAVVLTGLLLGLNVIDSNLCIKEEDLDAGSDVIDLTGYLKSANAENALVDHDPLNPESMAAVLDQKSYVEELNRHLTAQVSNLQARIASLTATNCLLKEDLAATKNHNLQLADETRALGAMLLSSHGGTPASKTAGEGQRDPDGAVLGTGMVREGGDGASCSSPPAATKSETFDQSQAVNALKKKLAGEECETQRLLKELEIQTAIKNEMETAMRLLEKDIHEKQDTIVSLRRQLEDIKGINLGLYKKLQESETSVKHKVEMVSRLEGKAAAMAETIKAFEAKMVNLESEKRAAEETARKLGQQMADKDLALTTLESDLKVEREWRNSLQETLVKDRDRMVELNEEIFRLTKVSRDYDALQVAFKDLERTCDDYERSMEELGVHLYESKLKVDDLKEATGAMKNAQWKEDSEVTKCHGCEKEFSISRRKHHCRACGSIFCHVCSDNRMPLQCSKKPVRVCDGCYTRLLERYSAGDGT